MLTCGISVSLRVFRWCLMFLFVSWNLCSPCGGTYSRGFDALQVSCVLLSYFLFFLVSHVLTQMAHVTPCLPALSCTSCASASILQDLQNNEICGGGDRKIG